MKTYKKNMEKTLIENEELKTLKDIEDEDSDDIILFKKEIKAEIIKWVKKRREIKQPMTESSFMLFHNIKEEDLI